MLSSTVPGSPVITFLYLGRNLLISVALAVSLTIPLAQVVAFLQRWRLRRTRSVVLVFLLVSVVMIAVRPALSANCPIARTISVEEFVS